jgi:hypothetical protein
MIFKEIIKKKITEVMLEKLKKKKKPSLVPGKIKNM